MSILSTHDLRSLAAARHDACVSLYLPTERAGQETRGNPIRLKNLLREAEGELETVGNGSAGGLLRPARDLLDESDFWRHTSDGLAIFLAPDLSRIYRLPRRFDELAVVSDRFHVKPLLPLLEEDGRFHVLALSRGKVRVIEATRHGERELDLHDIPREIRDVVGYDWEQRSLQLHSSGAPRGGGRGPAIFHGHGAAGDEQEDELPRFLRAVDDGLQKLLPDRTVPLVVAAVEEVQAEFRAISRHPRLLDDGIEGNPDEIDAATLRERAWPIVEPHFVRGAKEAVARFRELSSNGSGLASGSLEAILPATVAGRVETVLLTRGKRAWGRFDAERGQVRRSRERAAEDEDLLNRAALETLARGGTVRTLPPEEMPEDTLAAAIYRYPVHG